MIGQALLNVTINQMELGRIPDSLVRWGIRRLCAQRLKDEIRLHDSGARKQFVEEIARGSIAVETDSANEQHYELPEEFFGLVLGKNRKYSGCFWPEGTEDLDRAEDASLAETCERAGLEDGMDVLELGCGWGSLSLWMAAHYPQSRITAVSNSHSQKRYIDGEAERRGISNLTIVTADMNDFETEGTFDRVVSVEMFEHMRNYERLMQRIASWLKDDGRLFIHVFCHQSLFYPFEVEGSDDWMGRYFFTGGVMPSEHFIDSFDQDLVACKKWKWDGTHYERTSNAWLLNMDRNAARILEIFRETYGERDAARWFNRWRVFFMACAELFGYDGGDEWFVSHTLFQKRS